MAGWLSGSALVAVAALRQAQILDTTWEIALIGVSPLVLILSLPLGLAAVAGRRWLLSALCAGLMVCWGLWAGPDLWPMAHAARADGPALRLFDANVSQSNPDLSEIGGEIVRSDAQVVVLEELTPAGLTSLRGSGDLEPYRWSLVRAENGSGGMGLWSRVRATDLRAWTVGAYQVEVEGWIHPPRAPAVRLDGVHVYAPAFGPDQPERWKQQLARIRDHLATQPRPLLVAGDLNSTWDLLPFQRILHLGLSDAAVEAGKGWDMTWPRNQAPVLPYLRLDHVLYSRQLTVTSYRLGQGTGSDHRPLLVDIAPAPSR